MNQNPIITPDIFDPIEQDSGFLIFNITGNDIDPEGRAITIQNTGNPTGGSWAILSGTGNTSLEFAPAPGFTGIASIDYTIIDAGGGTAQGTFQIEVLPFDPYAGFERGSEGRDVLFGSLFASNEIFGAAGNDKIFGGFSNDHLAGGEGRDTLFGLFGDDILDGNEGRDKLFGGFGNDLLDGGAGSDFLHGGRGLDTALYDGSVLGYQIDLGQRNWSIDRISDGTDTDRLRQVEQAQFDDALLFLDGRNNAVFAQDDDAGATSEDTALTINVADLLANDVDFDGDALTLTGVSATSANGAGVTLMDGLITYDPGTVFDGLNDGETATDSFTYTVDDGRGGMATATATVVIEGETDNTAPIALDTAVATNEDAGVITFDLNSLVSDFDGDTLTFATPVATGTAPVAFDFMDGVISLDTDQFTFLGVGQSQQITLEYGVDDGSGAVNSSATATVTFEVEGRNDAPVFTNPTIATNEDVGVIFFDLNPFISDADTNDMVRVGAFSPAPGTFVSASLSDGVVRLNTAQFDGLAAGETFSGAFDVEIVDDSGAPNNIGVGQVFLTVEGRDEVPAALSVAPDDGFDLTF